MATDDPSNDGSLPETVLVVAGPTAVGKSALAVELAEAVNAEIVGADSRQVYRRVDVGTAKPEPELLRRAEHHMIDVAEPDDDFDVGRWREGALEALRVIHARGRPAIVCGGTGLYLRSLTQGLVRTPGADASVRRRLEAEEAARPGALGERLREVDPAASERLHPNDRVRIVRALEVFELTGRPLSEHQREHALAERPFEVVTLVLEMETAELDRRIEQRSRAMIEAGLLQEVRELRAEGCPPAARSLAAIGYREAAQCLDGALAEDELSEAVALATRRYAKRQRTWLRGQVLATPEITGAVSIDATDLIRAQEIARTHLS